jgi:hypothetical protein
MAFAEMDQLVALLVFAFVGSVSRSAVLWASGMASGSGGRCDLGPIGLGVLVVGVAAWSAPSRRVPAPWNCGSLRSVYLLWVACLAGSGGIGLTIAPRPSRSVVPVVNPKASCDRGGGAFVPPAMN